MRTPVDKTRDMITRGRSLSQARAVAHARKDADWILYLSTEDAEALVRRMRVFG